MKAVVIKEKDHLPEYLEWELPEHSVDRILLQVKAASLNHRDVWIMKGQYAGLKYPIIPGSDACGVFEDEKYIVNPGFYWGDNESFQSKRFQILGLPDHGSLAEWVAVPPEQIFPKPIHLDDCEAAALGLAGVTAYRALVSTCNPESSENLLITGIGGGVALFALQFASALNLNVFVSSSSSEKIKKAKHLGAREGVNYSDDNWVSQLNSMVPDGFDIIVDGAGGPAFNALVKLAKPGGRICLYGGTRGKVPDFIPQPVFWKQLKIFGSTMGSPLDFRNMLKLINSKQIVPVIDQVFPLSQASEAFKKMDQGSQFGKIVLKV